MIRKNFFIVLLLGCQIPLFAQAPDLTISQKDVRIEQLVDGGFHLFIRKKPNIHSVLITETTKDPAMREDNYAYRAPQWNPINGNEKRVLDGYFISPESKIYSLIDSTPEPDAQFGQAFQIYIPYIIDYGYANTRHGEVYVTNGTYLNLRAFAFPYADYRGPFKDNPFVIQVTQKPLPGPPEGNYMKDTVDTFTQIVQGKGNLVYSTGRDDLVKKIRDLLDKEKGKNIDLVICLDTTGSMKDDIASLQKSLVPMLTNMVRDFQSFRIGMVLYKDYNEIYLTKDIPFTTDLTVFDKTLKSIYAGGGRDIPEAVYEGLYDGAVKFPWAAQTRMLLLIGDAPPHPRPMGRITREMVDQATNRLGLKVNAIILPQ